MFEVIISSYFHDRRPLWRGRYYIILHKAWKGTDNVVVDARNNENRNSISHLQEWEGIFSNIFSNLSDPSIGFRLCHTGR